MCTPSRIFVVTAEFAESVFKSLCNDLRVSTCCHVVSVLHYAVSELFVRLASIGFVAGCSDQNDGQPKSVVDSFAEMEKAKKDLETPPVAPEPVIPADKPEMAMDDSLSTALAVILSSLKRPPAILWFWSIETGHRWGLSDFMNLSNPGSMTNAASSVW